MVWIDRGEITSDIQHLRFGVIRPSSDTADDTSIVLKYLMKDWNLVLPVTRGAFERDPADLFDGVFLTKVRFTTGVERNVIDRAGQDQVVRIFEIFEYLMNVADEH